MLFSGKTVEGIKVNKGYSFKAYFDPDGTIRAKYAVGEREGRWRIDDKGRKCVKWEGSDNETCMAIVKTGEVYKEYNPYSGKILN